MKWNRITKNRKLGPALISLRSPRWILIALVLGGLTGCSALGILAPPPTSTPAPTGTKVVLPATWTKMPPTITATPSLTPSPTASPTITMTHTPISSPTGTFASDQLYLESSPTASAPSARQSNCTLTSSEPGVRINPAPFIDPYHVLPTMEPGKPYQAVLTKPTYTLLVDGGQPLGWVDYRLVVLTSAGNDCLTVYDEREVWDFPLCFFTPLKDISGYGDSGFTEPMHQLSPSSSYVVLYQSEKAYFSAYGSAGPSFYVNREEVSTHGNCGDIPTLAKATTETSLYSDLPGQGGSVVYTLAVDEPIFLQSRRQDGQPPPGAVGNGEWILARRHSWSEDINGWVWSGHVEEK